MLRTEPPEPTGNAARVFQQNKWMMWSLEEGLEQLPSTIVRTLAYDERVQLHKNKPCTRIQFENNKAKVCISLAANESG